MLQNKYLYFAMESNRIEGENSCSYDQIKAVLIAYELNEDLTLCDILNLHSKCFKAGWAGRWRDCQVNIGGHIPPTASEVPRLMEEWYAKWPNMDSWEAHNTFEAIHPFQDGNGRLGRLIWLAKAKGEGYRFQRGFLHQYYYQTLTKTTE